MVVSTQELTSLRNFEFLPVSGYKNGRMRDLVLPSSPEPLNGTAGNSLSLTRLGEGHSTLASGARNRDATMQRGRISPTGLMPLFLAERAVHPSIPPTHKWCEFP